ncbi:Uncharacterized protein dnl_55550 [Desulfonema limicola]|uniref:Uncharacterized protein n=1 Tax=Desulfonema limicola TaxID=45656 RepID=A0A975GJ16_9BACT|nr:Uncharacterized protein dnl_55550 [Desulfonema limicola]
MPALAARAATGGCPYNMLQNLCAGAYCIKINRRSVFLFFKEHKILI